MIDGRHSCWREAEIVSGNKTTKRHCSPARPPATEIDCLLDMFPISILQFTRANFFFFWMPLSQEGSLCGVSTWGQCEKRGFWSALPVTRVAETYVPM